jgi:3-oxoisoapionate decarboxylase
VPAGLNLETAVECLPRPRQWLNHKTGGTAVVSHRRQYRSTFLKSALPLAAAATARPSQKPWPLGINTYCLRFWKWNDRQLFDYCAKEKLDAIFLQDSIDPGLNTPAHWAEVRASSKDTGMHLETGGDSLLPKTVAQIPESIATLRKNIERAHAMGSPVVRANLTPSTNTL